MGNEICSCLNNLTGLDSEDLSREGNEENNTKKVKKKPKVVLNRKDSLESSEPFQSQKEKETISTNMNSEYKNTLTSYPQSQKKQENKKKLNSKQKNNPENKNNNKNNINNNNNKILDNNNKVNKNSGNNNKNEIRNKKEKKVDLEKILKREEMVSENFNKFFKNKKIK